MSKEFHVFTHQELSFEQAFVFEIERHETDKLIEFKDLYMITSTPHGELRNRIKFDDMIQSIIHTEGGNLDKSNVHHIVDLFKDLLPVEKEIEYMQIVERAEIENIDPELLISGYEQAIITEQYGQINNENTKGTT